MVYLPCGSDSNIGAACDSAVFRTHHFTPNSTAGRTVWSACDVAAISASYLTPCLTPGQTSTWACGIAIRFTQYRTRVAADRLRLCGDAIQQFAFIHGYIFLPYVFLDSEDGLRDLSTHDSNIIFPSQTSSCRLAYCQHNTYLCWEQILSIIPVMLCSSSVDPYPELVLIFILHWVDSFHASKVRSLYSLHRILH